MSRIPSFRVRSQVKSSSGISLARSFSIVVKVRARGQGQGAGAYAVLGLPIGNVFGAWRRSFSDHSLGADFPSMNVRREPATE